MQVCRLTGERRAALERDAELLVPTTTTGPIHECRYWRTLGAWCECDGPRPEQRGVSNLQGSGVPLKCGEWQARGRVVTLCNNPTADASDAHGLDRTCPSRTYTHCTHCNPKPPLSISKPMHTCWRSLALHVAVMDPPPSCNRCGLVSASLLRWLLSNSDCLNMCTHIRLGHSGKHCFFLDRHIKEIPLASASDISALSPSWSLLYSWSPSL